MISNARASEDACNDVDVHVLLAGRFGNGWREKWAFLHAFNQPGFCLQRLVSALKIPSYCLAGNGQQPFGYIIVQGRPSASS